MNDTERKPVSPTPTPAEELTGYTAGELCRMGYPEALLSFDREARTSTQKWKAQIDVPFKPRPPVDQEPKYISVAGQTVSFNGRSGTLLLARIRKYLGDGTAPVELRISLPGRPPIEVKGEVPEGKAGGLAELVREALREL